MGEKIGNEMFWSEHWCIDEENNAWVLSSQFNTLCRVNMNDNVVKYIGRLPLSFTGERQFSYSICIGNKVYFLPDQSSQVDIYHKDNGEFSIIDLSGLNIKGRLRCTDARLIDDKLWIYSSGCGLFICIDLEKEEVEKSCTVGNEMILWDYEIVWIDKNAYVTTRDASMIYKFDTETQEINSYDYRQVNDKFRTIQICGNSLYVSGESGNLYCIDKENMKCCECINVQANILGAYPYLYSCYLNGKIWLIPYESNKLISVDVGSKKIECVKDFSEKREHEEACYGVNYIRDGRFIGISKFYNDGLILEIDTEKQVIQNRRYIFNSEEICRMMREINSFSNAFYRENRFYGIGNFLKTI